METVFSNGGVRREEHVLRFPQSLRLSITAAFLSASTLTTASLLSTFLAVILFATSLLAALAATIVFFAIRHLSTLLGLKLF
jgi:hypothetical protein